MAYVCRKHVHSHIFHIGGLCITLDRIMAEQLANAGNRNIRTIIISHIYTMVSTRIGQVIKLKIYKKLKCKKLRVFLFIAKETDQPHNCGGFWRLKLMLEYFFPVCWSNNRPTRMNIMRENL